MLFWIIKATMLGITFIVPLIYWQGSIRRAEEVSTIQPPTDVPVMKTLLLWTKWYGLADGWGLPESGFSWEENQHTDLRDIGCDEESYKCTITSNRFHLEDESLYDGYIFHHYGINQVDVPDQTKRKASQVYMYYNMEPANREIYNQNQYFAPSWNNDFFNLTMSYNSESGIHVPYGRVLKTGDHPTGEELDKYILNFGRKNAMKFGSKNFSATIVNSNCVSWGGREAVIAEQGKLMPVDVFGKCGQPLPDEGYVHLNFLGSPFSRIYKQLGQTYPFYLSFENALCEDYVTERLFLTMGADMIPVVSNWANMSRIAPKHSYIDVKDFASIKDLVTYLEQVHSDPALYASYFWWRDFYQVDHSSVFTRGFNKFFCEACRYLHNGKGPSVVEDLQKELVEGKCKIPPIIS